MMLISCSPRIIPSRAKTPGLSFAISRDIKSADKIVDFVYKCQLLFHAAR